MSGKRRAASSRGRLRGHVLGLALGTVVAGVLPVSAWSQAAGGDYRITSSSLDGGGGTVTGGAFRATTTIAQADAHAATIGGAFRARGGLWPQPANDRLFAHDFEP